MDPKIDDDSAMQEEIARLADVVAELQQSMAEMRRTIKTLQEANLAGVNFE